MAQLCIRWNDQEASILRAFREMYVNQNLTDVTLGAEQRSIKAHKVVLAACSPYFQSLFMDNPNPSPTVLMRDAKFDDLKALVDFIYHGEVIVGQDQLATLLKTAESLQITQLSVVFSNPSSQTTQSVLGSFLTSDGTQVTFQKRKRKRKPKTKQELVESGDGTVSHTVEMTDTSVVGETTVVGDSSVADGGDGHGTDGNLSELIDSPTGSRSVSSPKKRATIASHEVADASRILELSMAEIVANPDGSTSDASGAQIINVGGHIFTSAEASPSTTVIVVRKKSFVWNHFTETGKGTVRCRICSKQIAFKDPTGSTSNMIKHLKTAHNIDQPAKMAAKDDSTTVVSP